MAATYGNVGTEQYVYASIQNLPVSFRRVFFFIKNRPFVTLADFEVFWEETILEKAGHKDGTKGAINI